MESKQIRNIAVSGVDTLEKANKVCEIVGDDGYIFCFYTKVNKWFYDFHDDIDEDFMLWKREDGNNFKNCTQMSFEQFLEKYDSKDDNELTYSEHQDAKREMEKDSEPEKEQKMSETEQIKKEYEKNPDKWVVYVSLTLKELSFKKDLNPTWYTGYTYKLILKKHEHIADAIIVNPDVEVEYLTVGLKPNYNNKHTQNFFNFYDNKREYRLAKPQCDGKYRKANYLDIKYGATIYIYGDDSQYHKMTIEDVLNPKDRFKAFVASDGCRYGLSSANILETSTTKDIQINSMEDLNELPIVGEEMISTTISVNGKIALETISIKDDNGKEYKFEKPEFDASLLEIVISSLYIVGYVEIENCIYPCQWKINSGECFLNGEWQQQYNLTPIKPKWYEEESNFPCIITTINGNGIVHRAKGYKINGDKQFFTLDCDSHVAPFTEWRVLTKEEIDNLYYQGKE